MQFQCERQDLSDTAGRLPGGRMADIPYSLGKPEPAGCGTGPGCIAGGPMTVFGSSTMIEGGSGLYNAYNGSSTPGINPLRNGFNQIMPTWGNTVYDGLNLTASIIAMGVQVPLKVGVTDGINRTESIFGATVPRFNNATLNPLTKMSLPYGVTQGTLLYGAGSQGAAFINDIRKAGESK
jgi:filamentous hemagglutinin